VTDRASTAGRPDRTVFISYSRKDDVWRDRLLTHLRVLENDGLLKVWSDSRLQTGTDWEEDIEAAVQAARVAILLVSANFLTSRFILDTELPQLFRRREKDGLRLYPIIITPCAWKAIAWLGGLQVRPAGARPLSGGTDYEIDLELSEIAHEILDLISASEPKEPPPPKVRPPEPTNDEDRPLVMGLFGLQTRTTWQRSLGDALRDEGFGYYPVTHGFSSVLSVLLPGAFKTRLERFVRLYADLTAGRSRLPSAIADGYGAYLFGSAVLRYPQLRFERAILLNSPLPTHFPWSSVVSKGSVQAILHEYGHQGFLIRLLVWAMSDAGRSGALGFTDLADGSVIQRAQPYFAHSDFYGGPGSLRTWMAFLRGDAPPEFDRPPRALTRRSRSSFVTGRDASMIIKSEDQPPLP
jgi:hypothetical protein